MEGESMPQRMPKTDGIVQQLVQVVLEDGKQHFLALRVDDKVLAILSLPGNDA
ncbi:hypothetical protein SESBI_18627 [Sesbania bispinosa]|nr:hypothetical protein SESBI_18627 [Sesbania bispinosa]